ncbi:MAG TPA: biopolymer transporter ExbD [Verrucomicrobiales bacterium]|nr:biopolymer transporter ExbD [Verrucomicrobiales bacterium]HCN78779.1 biopolymer transporter ExbD [Verrucomicrobiales bacterium]HRJ07482.1 biopolymer transporter ExbD [Prosthecobacter sp.]HRK13669.1 biopolymer transporter ExbD [Prosthecobacter sp.]
MNFRKQHSIEPTPMQLAPLVDVLLLLVIFFAVTSHYASVEQIMDVSVPAADTGKDDRARNVGEIIVNIKQDGVIIVNGQEVTASQLLRNLANIVAVNKDQAVILRGDEQVPYQNVVSVLDTCQKAGIWNIAFATRKPDAEAPQN